jgi:small nuclear ribonucleoprotein (snRNP)-like protein
VSLNKVVVAFLDGRRLRGRVFDFSPAKDVFRLCGEKETQQKSQEVALKELKAVFFVKDFRGNNAYRESQKVEAGKPGRKVQVTFSDGEKIVGTTQGYEPGKIGFFVFPADAKSNSKRIFVVNWNVRDVKFL